VAGQVATIPDVYEQLPETDRTDCTRMLGEDIELPAEPAP